MGNDHEIGRSIAQLEQLRIYARLLKAAGLSRFSPQIERPASTQGSPHGKRKKVGVLGSFRKD